jgi:hypothetical protein
MPCKPPTDDALSDRVVLGEATLSCGRRAEASGQLGLRRGLPHASFGGVLVALLLPALLLLLAVPPLQANLRAKANASSSERRRQTT